jgi:hypothetical protein
MRKMGPMKNQISTPSSLGALIRATKSFKYLPSSFELKIREIWEESVHRWMWPYWESARRGGLEKLPKFEQHSETSSHYRGLDVPSIWCAQKLDFFVR